MEFWGNTPSTGLDALYRVVFDRIGGPQWISYNVTGGAKPAPVPEPTSLSILAAALGLLLIGSRVVRRRRQAGFGATIGT